MKHARKDYDQIQDPSGKIPEDEPVFLIRAQDIVGPAVVSVWALIASLSGASSDIVNAASAQSKEMLKWQRKHGVKVPDL